MKSKKVKRYLNHTRFIICKIFKKLFLVTLQPFLQQLRLYKKQIYKL